VAAVRDRQTALRFLRLLALLAGLVATSAIAAPSASAHRRHHHRRGHHQHRVLGPSPALFNREAYGFRSRLSLRAEARRYSLIVLQASDGPLVPRLRAYNHHLRILLYEMSAYSRISDSGPWVDCTSYAQDLVLHPNWFLLGRMGSPIGSIQKVSTPPDRFVMDVGNRAYQQACVAHAISVAKSYGFDGIMWDGLNAKLQFLTANVQPYTAAYPNDSAWQAAEYSFLSYAGAAAHAAGLQVFANIGGARIGTWAAWNGPLDGAEEEAYTDIGDGLAQFLWWWPYQLANVAWSQAHGKLVILHSHNLTDAGNVFGLASMLLVCDSACSYSTSNGGYSGYEAWYPEYTAAERLGPPRGGYHVVRGGVHIRRFAGGIVVVNPSLSTVGGVRLRGLYWLGGRLVTRVTLGPTSALILLAG
jgi:hypothetical protein